MKIHELSLIFPSMSSEDFAKLKADLKLNGQLDEIAIYKNKILDGRHRYRACLELKIKPRYKQYEGNDPLGFVISSNMARRHLTSTQKACVGQEVLQYVEKAAKKRQSEGGKHIGLRNLSQNKSSHQLEQKIAQAGNDGKQITRAPQSSAIVAKLVGSNRNYIQDIKNIRLASQELFDKVKSGTLALDDAKRLIKLKEQSLELFDEAVTRMENAPELKARDVIRAVQHEKISANNVSLSVKGGKKFRIFIADPPWSYGESMAPGTTSPADYYPLMSLDEICAMPVKKIAAENSVLFLWVPTAHLEASFRVIASWGFFYKSNIIWWKQRNGKGAHNMGHYTSVQHEHLLIATRGSATPDVKKQFPSVVMEERGEHSSKPPIFYDMIEALYKHGEKIELFSRNPRKGWHAFGNQSQDGKRKKAKI